MTDRAERETDAVRGPLDGVHDTTDYGDAVRAGLPVLVAEDPLTCVVRGCGMALERMERLGSIFTSE